MLLRFTAALFGLALAAATGSAQTAAEQMQKAIYAQQTAGDLDTAIRGYRQILNSSPADRKLAAEAQFRLAQALLQKGEMEEAAREFVMLANYPEYRDTIAALAGKARQAARGSVISRGTYSVSNTVAGRSPGHYSHKASGVELMVPPGWTINDGASSDGGDIALLTDPGNRTVAVWMMAEQHSASELEALLRHDVQTKSSMRPEGWKVRPESVLPGRSANGQMLRAIADYTAGGVKMIEILVWCRTPRTHALFFGSVPASEQAAFAESFAQVVTTAIVP